MARSGAQTSLDKSRTHQYVIDETLKFKKLGLNCKWKTSKIIREKKDQTSPIVKIKIITR